ncbi:MAG: hypothetical protein J6C43_04390 [Oscillospiraceae bacterium]|nr:hypothetical protein [Oscillospiraceae bacterium]
MSDMVLVRSLAGHDKDQVFCVVGREEGYLLLCDGKNRRLASPKRKKAMHTCAEEFDHPTLEKLIRQEPVTDKDIRKALWAFRAKEV